MTREEAISEARRSTIDDCDWFHDDDIITSEQNSIALVNKIYDDFESGTCMNCKHYERFGICGVVSYFVNAEDKPQVSDDFCCNQWKAKE